MQKIGFLVAAGLSALTMWACTVDTNNNNGAGGSGGSASSSGSSTSSSTGPTSGSGGSMPVCDGLLNPGVCSDCAAAMCCVELDACANDGTCWDCLSNGAGCDPMGDNFTKLQACLQTSCAAECAPVEYPMGAPNCDAPKEVPSGGSCTSLGGNVKCNPVTNEGCNVAGGEACDFSSGNEFICFGPPNDTPMCGACDNMTGPFCEPGYTCIEGKCARYCCDDKDCGPDATCSGAYPANGGKVGACVGGNTMSSSSSSSTGSSSSSGSGSSSSGGGAGGAGGMGMGGMGGMGSSSSGSSASSSGAGGQGGM